MGKKKTTVALDVDLLNWVEKMIGYKRFSSLTHALEYGLQRLRENQVVEFHLGAVDGKEES